MEVEKNIIRNAKLNFLSIKKNNNFYHISYNFDNKRYYKKYYLPIVIMIYIVPYYPE